MTFLLFCAVSTTHRYILLRLVLLFPRSLGVSRDSRHLFDVNFVIWYSGVRHEPARAPIRIAHTLLDERGDLTPDGHDDRPDNWNESRVINGGVNFATAAAASPGRAAGIRWPFASLTREGGAPTLLVKAVVAQGIQWVRMYSLISPEPSPRT